MQVIILSNIKNYWNSRGMCDISTKVCVLGQKLEMKMSDNVIHNFTNMNDSRTEYISANSSGSGTSHGYCNLQCNNFNWCYVYNGTERRQEESIRNVKVNNFGYCFNCPTHYYPSFVPFTRPPLYHTNYYQHNLFHLPHFQHNSNRSYFHRRPQVGTNRNLQHDGGKYIMSLRLWENIVNERSVPKPGFTFTLMSYNVLAQDLLDQHPELYRRHNQSALKWETRWLNLLSEIKKMNPDILCLQEVQVSHLEDYYSLLGALGYQGIFKKRTGDMSDGCAIYYKVDKVTLIESTTVEYFQESVHILNRNNVGIVAKFAPKLHPTREFVVATTHLLYNPARNDIRLAQMQVLMSEIDRISYKKPTIYLPIVLTGDFNSPHYSDVYKFVINNTLRYDRLGRYLVTKNGGTKPTLVTSKLGITDNCQHVDLLENRNNDIVLKRFDELKLIDINNSDHNIKREPKKIIDKPHLFSTGTLSHNFAFKSVYKDVDKESTTYQDKWLTVDYIFYTTKRNNSGDNLKLISRYRLPTEKELYNVWIPNHSLGSDHLSLTAKFKLEF